MHTPCSSKSLQFLPHGRRRVEAAFDAGHITSDGGLLLLRDVALATAFFDQLAECFHDFRDPRYVEHSVKALLAQRVLGIACGYEDLNDHDKLRFDPLLALAVEKLDLLGEDRARARDRGRALAGSATLNRIELAPEQLNPERPDLKLLHDTDCIEAFFVDFFLDAHETAPSELVLDLDFTDIPLHGMQEHRFFHGYYDHHCYLPLYIVCGEHVLVAKLRPASSEDMAGVLKELKRVVAHIRRRWPDVHIVVRGDSGFCRDLLMQWCEQASNVDFVFGLARNPRLTPMIEEELAQMQVEVERTGEPARCFRDLRYRTKKSWSRERRVIAKAEYLPGKSNARFIVTSLPPETHPPDMMYEQCYCARGDMENRLKEQQLGMFADRASGHTLRANQMRLWLSTCAYALVQELRRTGLRGTPLEKAQAWTIRTSLLKLGARVLVSVRRVKLSFSSSHPMQEVFATVQRNLRMSYPMVF